MSAPLAAGPVVAGSSVNDAFLAALHDLGVRQAFGLVGGAIAPFCDALGRSRLESFQLRHEAGALFAAVEASIATGRPVLAFVTTGPGLLNALTGAMAARWEGARLVLVSGATSPAQRGRWAVQESGPASMPNATVYQPSEVFHDAALLERVEDLPAVFERLAEGFSRPGGFVAHYGLTIALQRARASLPAVEARPVVRPAPDPAVLAAAAAALGDEPFVLWLGHGAREAGPAVRRFVERTGTPVIATPRGKGVLPESHPAFVGVTGCGGHEHVEAALAALGIRRAVVLGSKLGEFSSCWAPGLVPPGGFVHVDVDPTAFGAAYPDAPTLGVEADAAAFLDALLPLLPARALPAVPRPAPPVIPAARGPILPQEVLLALQERVIDGSTAPVLAESGNSFLWANGWLRPDTGDRYRVSGLWGSMGHATSGVFGLAAARGKAIALVGDGAMLMMNEVSSAVQYGLPAAWVVLNDARMGIVQMGMASSGLRPFDTELPSTDFAALARAMGATGERVTRAEDLGPALDRLLAAPGPYVLDVLIDPDEPSPFARRVSTLLAMGNASPDRSDR